MSDEVGTPPMPDEAQQIMDALAESLIAGEAARGAFVGGRTQETLAVYMATLDRMDECEEAVRSILNAARFSNKLEDIGFAHVEQAQRQAHDQLFKKDADN